MWFIYTGLGGSEKHNQEKYEEALRMEMDIENPEKVSTLPYQLYPRFAISKCFTVQEESKKNPLKVHQL